MPLVLQARGWLTVMYGHAYSNCGEGHSAKVRQGIEESEGVEIWQLRHKKLNKTKSDDAIWELECFSIRVVCYKQSLQPTHSCMLRL